MSSQARRKGLFPRRTTLFTGQCFSIFAVRIDSLEYKVQLRRPNCARGVATARFGRQWQAMKSRALLDEAASASEEALISAVQETVKISSAEVSSLTATSLVVLFGHFASAFSTHFVFACLKVLITPRHASERSVQFLQRLIRNPMATGIDILRIAMDLESKLGVTPTPEEREYVVERYRNARSSFDFAAQNADENEKAAISLYRGLTSTKIPGGHREALRHFRDFANRCSVSAVKTRQPIDEKLKKAKGLREKASRILVEHVRGLGAGTFLAMGAYEDLVQRAGYIFEAKRYEAEARDLERRARAFDAAVKAIQIFESGDQDHADPFVKPTITS